ncbi:MAG: prepilin peptidase [Firmicutes bacterium]|jgi:leader peptidase (prepilin peptidase)/N-methyltransferase|nr:prepilin peptidase [Bacillota bacterium]
MFYFYTAVWFIVGLAVGSFANVVIYRFPRGISLVKTRSCCPSCKNRLVARELIPLLGYLLCRGRCRHCRARISPRYFLIELATGLLFVAVVHRTGANPEALGLLFLLCLLLIISFIDIDFQRIPNVLLGIGLAAGIIFKLLDPAGRTLPSWIEAGWGMLLGGGIMLLIYIGARGAIGAGDLKLMIMIGFFVGKIGVLAAMMMGFILGGAYGLVMIALRRLDRKDMIPFGPFLSLGAAIQVFFGEQILQWLGLNYF